ncbi:MAG: hypothetical protein A3G64_02780 [Candidatus Liptonbacteria bacterium RIFCSPLOWO2_12_FULL_60_15]|uniref:Uncharacterized protein n=1 Tax=Candidatus Liptonbacteria bacterium RIFCSPLOWO2_12_FULL_60_15 TaxID=1798653 RepID=A0A1G2CQG5_9BACT|nr:MAG: hypothetical protein A3G64_02780 [Candidatus Liptonbacteria bacterium RIFCSPLOWO2_12_FULL_60_15]
MMGIVLAGLLLAQQIMTPLPPSAGKLGTLDICRLEPGVKVVILFMDSLKEVTRFAVADAEGRVRFENLPEGEWVVIEGGGQWMPRPGDKPIDVDGHTVYPFSECIKMPT